MWHLKTGEVIYHPKAMVIGDVQYPASLFSQPESVLNDLEIFTLKEVHPPLSGPTQRYSNPVDDFTAHTRTYPVVDKSETELANEANSASANNVEQLRREAETAEIAKLIAGGTTEEAVAYTASVTERAAKFPEEIEEIDAGK